MYPPCEYMKQVSFGRAARTHLLKLINTQNGTLRAHPRPSQPRCSSLQRISAKNPCLGKHPLKCLTLFMLKLRINHQSQTLSLQSLPLYPSLSNPSLSSSWSVWFIRVKKAAFPCNRYILMEKDFIFAYTVSRRAYSSRIFVILYSTMILQLRSLKNNDNTLLPTITA
jgi:hypothetical protein